MQKDRLLNRLDDIGRSLEGRESALALLALGSVGTELDRIDAYSDLDFFVIVADGSKQAYLDDLSWISSVHPVDYCFLNTSDGYKLLFDDGIYAEFAVFTLEELGQLSFPEGRIVWKRAGVDDAIRFPRMGAGTGEHPAREKHSLEWVIGEAVTNLYVGLGRYRRGEYISAFRLVQGYAVDRVIELASYLTPDEAIGEVQEDAFAPERRFEQRFPGLAGELPHFMQGYERSAESAASILAFLERHWQVNPAIAQAIRALLPSDVEGSGE